MSKLWIKVFLSLRDNIVLLVEIATFAGISNIGDIGSYAFLILIILNRVVGLGSKKLIGLLLLRQLVL
jgi:hypothetical protein